MNTPLDNIKAIALAATPEEAFGALQIARADLDATKGGTGFAWRGVLEDILRDASHFLASPGGRNATVTAALHVARMVYGAPVGAPERPL